MTSPESLAERVGIEALEIGGVSTVEMGENVVLGKGTVWVKAYVLMGVVPTVNHGLTASGAWGQVMRMKRLKIWLLS